MEIQNPWKFLLLFFFVLGTAVTVTSCGDDDDDDSTPSKETISGNHSQATGEFNGHAWVDLGLPSGLKWATCNVGASSPEKYGVYFAWGETWPKPVYNWSTYKYGSDFVELTKYCTDSSHGYKGFKDNKTTLDAADDAATANWGLGWRMPTYEEQTELRDKCTWTWTTQNGVYGRKVTGPNGRSIFLPAAGYHYDSGLENASIYGYYWSSSLGSDRPDYACCLFVDSYYMDWYSGNRRYGYSVRPVCQ